MSTAETYVSLRISKPGMTVDEVTTRLGIVPSDSHEAGDPSQHGVRFREALWTLSTQSDPRGPLAEHLTKLLDQVEPKTAILSELAAEGFAMDWFCFVPVNGMGGVSLEPGLLRRLADLPIALDLDIYG